MKKNNRGFTLLEILVVIMITMVLVTVLSGIFFSLLKVSTKSRVMADIKQNGNYALTVMNRMIRNARSISSPTLTSEVAEITIINPDNQTTTFSCTDGQIASNAANLIDIGKVKVVSVCEDIFTLTIDPAGAAPPVVDINFTLEQAQITDSAEEKGRADFSSKVILRNY